MQFTYDEFCGNDFLEIKDEVYNYLNESKGHYYFGKLNGTSDLNSEFISSILFAVAVLKLRT